MRTIILLAVVAIMLYWLFFGLGAFARHWTDVAAGIFRF
jgi:hypothetical protein